MNKLDKLILIVFSIVIFLESILLICILAGFVSYATVGAVALKILIDAKAVKILLGIAIVCILLSIKGIFFTSSDKTKYSKGILMQNDNGKLLITKSTIENISLCAIKNFEGIKDIDVVSEMTYNNELIVDVNLVANQNVVIKDITVEMQNKIKEAIKKTSDLEVKEVNVKIKNIITEDNNKIVK